MPLESSAMHFFPGSGSRRPIVHTAEMEAEGQEEPKVRGRRAGGKSGEKVSVGSLDSGRFSCIAINEIQPLGGESPPLETGKVKGKGYGKVKGKKRRSRWQFVRGRGREDIRFRWDRPCIQTSDNAKPYGPSVLGFFPQQLNSDLQRDGFRVKTWHSAPPSRHHKAPAGSDVGKYRRGTDREKNTKENDLDQTPGRDREGGRGVGNQMNQGGLCVPKIQN